MQNIGRKRGIIPVLCVIGYIVGKPIFICVIGGFARQGFHFVLFGANLEVVLSRDEMFDFTLEEPIDSFDPLAGEAEEVDIYDYDAPLESGIVRTDPKEFPSIEVMKQRTEEFEQQPACMRIGQLFDNMPSYNKQMLAILGLCATPQANNDVIAFVTKWQETDKGIFTPDTVIHHLHRAGALLRQTADGTDFETLDLSPKTVIIDGVEYLESAETPEIYWVTSPDGMDVVERNRPAEAMRELIEGEPQYLHIYRVTLDMAACENGVTEKNLGFMVDKDPALQNPRMYAARFLDHLYKVDCVKWNGNAWVLTELGQQAKALVEELSATRN